MRVIQDQDARAVSLRPSEHLASLAKPQEYRTQNILVLHTHAAHVKPHMDNGRFVRELARLRSSFSSRLVGLVHLAC